MDLAKDLTFPSTCFCTFYLRILRNVAFKSVTKDNWLSALFSGDYTVILQLKVSFFHFYKSKVTLFYKCVPCWCRYSCQPPGVTMAHYSLISEITGIGLNAERWAGFVLSPSRPLLLPCSLQQLSDLSQTFRKGPNRVLWEYEHTDCFTQEYLLSLLPEADIFTLGSFFPASQWKPLSIFFQFFPFFPLLLIFPWLTSTLWPLVSRENQMQMWEHSLSFPAEPLQSCCGETICAVTMIHFLCGAETGQREEQGLDLEKWFRNCV